MKKPPRVFQGVTTQCVQGRNTTTKFGATLRMSVTKACDAVDDYGPRVVVLFDEDKKCPLPAKVQQPLREALYALTLTEPPDFVTHQWWLGDFTQERLEELQQWCVAHARPRWSTGIGIMEAAERLVKEAVDNGNLIPRQVHTIPVAL